jgi:hypothetical protein
MNVDHKFAPEKSRPEDFLSPGARDIIWEHGRRNVSMRAAGLM